MNTFEEQKRKSAKPMLWISMTSMAMIFAGLTSAYVVRKAEGNWLDFDFPIWFYISTAFLLISSLTIYRAKKQLQFGNLNQVDKHFKFTILFGFLFCFSQVATWMVLINKGVYFTGPGSNASGSFLYVLTLLHLLHLVAGLIVLFVTYFNFKKGKYTKENMLGFELCSIFWHFLDFLWLYLFLFLVYIH